MNRWISELKQVGLVFFGRESSGEMWGLVVVCIAVSFLLYKKMSNGFVGRGEKTFLTLIPGVLLMALAAVAVRIFLDGSGLLQLSVVGVCFLVIVAPMTALVEKTKYLSAMIPWVVTAAVLAVILYIEPILVDAIKGGAEKGSLLKAHRDDMDAWDRL